MSILAPQTYTIAHLSKKYLFVRALNTFIICLTWRMPMQHLGSQLCQYAIQTALCYFPWLHRNALGFNVWYNFVCLLCVWSEPLLLWTLCGRPRNAQPQLLHIISKYVCWPETLHTAQQFRYTSLGLCGVQEVERTVSCRKANWIQ